MLSLLICLSSNAEADFLLIPERRAVDLFKRRLAIAYQLASKKIEINF